ncbi:MAG: TolC family protein, partial [Acidobacteriota bacterium]|nr:TolC family protein [Acidobacteriota bacterium]
MKFQILTILLFVLLAGIASGQTATVSPTPPVDVQTVQPEKLEGVPEVANGFESAVTSLPDIGRVGVDMTLQVPMTSREAIVMALENNKDIEVSRKDVKIAEYELGASYLPFTPVIAGATYFERATLPSVSIFNNNTTTSNTSLVGEFSYQGILRKNGTSYSATFKNRKLTTDNPVSILSPQYDSSIEFRINQPLFRGRKNDDMRRVIELAKKNLSLSDKQFRQKAIEITVSVQKAYWDLTYALRNLKVQRDGVRDARQQLEHNKRLVSEGVLAPIDILAAETQVAELELRVYTALEQVNRSENFLKNLIAENRDDVVWSKSLVPTDNVDLVIPKTTLEEALALAIENRIEFDILDVSKEINEYDKKFYKDQLDPIINLNASYTSSGIGGTANPGVVSFFSNTESAEKINEVITRVNTIDPNSPPISPLPIAPPRMVPERLTGSYFSSVTDIFANRYPTFRVGVTFQIAPDGKAQEALLGKALVQGDRIRVLREQLEQGIQVDVRNALQSLKTAEARMLAVATARS